MVLQTVVPVPRINHGTFSLHIRTLQAVTELVTHAGHQHPQLVDLSTSILQLPSLTSKPILVLVQGTLNVPRVRRLIVEESLEL